MLIHLIRVESGRGNTSVGTEREQSTMKCRAVQALLLRTTRRSLFSSSSSLSSVNTLSSLLASFRFPSQTQHSLQNHFLFPFHVFSLKPNSSLSSSSITRRFLSTSTSSSSSEEEEEEDPFQCKSLFPCFSLSLFFFFLNLTYM